MHEVHETLTLFFPMPIVNGTYVPESLPSPRAAQQQVFGEYSHKDMADYSQAAYNYLMKQQEQAYNLELWNLTNEYNSPAAQMQRFQDAGLNPFLIYQQQNTAGSPAAASAASFRSNGNYGKSVVNGISSIQQILGMVKSARETYDYMRYGRETSRWGMINAQESALGHKLENAWLDYRLHGENMIYGDVTRIPQGPAAQALQQDIAYRGQQIKQVGAIIKHYAKTDDRFDKLMELDDQRLAQMKGQYDWILTGFHTGNETLDQFLRMLMMFALNGNL